MEPLDARELRFFMAVARVGSIRGASRHLNVAPSVVSRRIADMERHVGLPLFERAARGAILTEAGALVLEHARRIHEEGDFLAEQMDLLRGVQQKRVRILCGEGFLADVVENGLGAFSPVYSDARYDVRLDGTEGILDGVANGDADIGIAYNPQIDTRLRSLAISRQPLCLVARPGHPLLEQDPLELSDCNGLPCALLGKGYGITRLVGRVAADRGLALSLVVETNSIDVQRRFVIAGLGVSFLPKFAVATELARGILAVRELTDALLADAGVHLMVRARRRLPLSVERLGGFLAAHMAAFK